MKKIAPFILIPQQRKIILDKLDFFDSLSVVMAFTL